MRIKSNLREEATTEFLPYLLDWQRLRDQVNSRVALLERLVGGSQERGDFSTVGTFRFNADLIEDIKAVFPENLLKSVFPSLEEEKIEEV